MSPGRESERTGRPGRRTLLAWTGAAGVGGLTLGAGGDAVMSAGRRSTARPAESDRLAPYDEVAAGTSLPAGLDRPVPAFGQVLSLRLRPDAARSPRRARSATIRLLRAVSRLPGRLADAVELRAESTASAALDSRPADLQITPGFGASLLTSCGLAAARPAALIELPAFAADALRPDLCGGDLLVQLGAEDPMRLAGATQAVLGAARADWTIAWSRPGFRIAAAAQDDVGTTPRNLMGHRDGTGNPELGSPLWRATVLASGDDWMAGGSYLVARQILIDLDRWYTLAEPVRDEVIGRRTLTGAGLGLRHESDEIDLSATDDAGRPVTPMTAHVRLANATNTLGARIYRRSWNFDDGVHDGSRRAGLIFLAWQADPRRGFVPIQRSLERGHDRLAGFLRHVGSAVFAAPAAHDDYPGQRLLER